jgi:hypothetical protein
MGQEAMTPDRAVQVHDGRGYCKDLAIERSTAPPGFSTLMTARRRSSACRSVAVSYEKTRRHRALRARQ